jgi:nucleotide-binding universal stress UspA family protein
MDFGAASIRAAGAALATTRHDGTVTLAHVATPTEIHPEAASEAFDRLLRALPVPDGIDVETLILEGDPVSALLRLASEENYDLIAVGSRAGIRSEFRVAGSVCLGLLLGAMGAVLIAPPPERGAE